MGRNSKESYNWAAGSYVDLFIVSAVTQVFFAVGLYWTFISDTAWVNVAPVLHSNIRILAIVTLPILGWVMALAIGIGFDRFPLDYKTAPFDPSLISTIVVLNISGQLLIMIGIITSNIDTLESLAKMGATLLGTQLILMGPLAWKLTRRGHEKVGWWAKGTLLSLPIIGILTILTWALVHHDWFYVLFLTVVLDGFWLMATFAFILGHFQDRLDWKLMSPKVTTQAFAVFAVLVIIHILLEFLYQFGTITDSYAKASISAPILWIFFISRPDRIWKHVLAGKPCSAQILSAYSCLLATAGMGIYEAIYIEEKIGMFYTRFMLIFGIVVQVAWGSSVYLHEDHNHIEIENRKTRWISVIMMLIMMGSVICLALNVGGHFDSLNSELVARIAVIALFIASFDFFFWLVRDAIFNHEDWHRIPMYYTNMNNGDDDDNGGDPYFPTESE